MTVITGEGQPNLSFVAIDLIRTLVVTKLEGRWRRGQSGRKLEILIAVGGLLVTCHCGQFVRAQAAVRAVPVRAVVITGDRRHLGSVPAGSEQSARFHLL